MRRALLIGINYGSQKSTVWSPLDETIGNVQDMKELLTECKYEITVVTDINNPPSHLIPKRQNIIAQLKDLVKGSAAGDRFVFQYAGHSHSSNEGPRCKEELDGRDEAIVPLGTSDDPKNCELIMDDELRQILVDTLHPGSQLIVVLDTCHSATLLDLRHRLCNSHTFGLSTLSVPPKHTCTLFCLTNPDRAHRLHGLAPVLTEGSATGILRYPGRRYSFGVASKGSLPSPSKDRATLCPIGNFMDDEPIQRCSSPEPVTLCGVFSVAGVDQNQRRRRTSLDKEQLVEPGPVRSTPRMRLCRRRPTIPPTSPRPCKDSNMIAQVSERVEQAPSARRTSGSPSASAMFDELTLTRAPSRGSIPDLSRKRKQTHHSIEGTGDFGRFNECDGSCNDRHGKYKASDTLRANVICFSSCMDEENSVEYEGESMTKMLIDAINSHPEKMPSVKNVVDHIDLRYTEMVDAVRKSCNALMIGPLSKDERRKIEEMLDWSQHLQVSSMKPLDPNAKIVL